MIGIAGAGFKLSLVLNAINCEISNAPYEIKAISKSLIIYSHLLKQTAAVLEKGNSIHSQEALRTLEQIVEESNAVYADINTMLDRVRTTKSDGTVSPSVSQRFKWCFRKHGIEYLLGRLDRLQISLSLMLQIIQLGTIMASTSRHDSPARVEHMTNQIQRERVEAQTIVIQFFQENESLHRLYMAAREEETEPRSPIESRHDHDDSNSLTLVTSQDSQPTKVEDSVGERSRSLMVISPYKGVLGGYAQSWAEMGKSAEAMLKESDGVINQMLERWTRWRERREQDDRRPRSKTSGRYNPAVHDFQDEDDDLYGNKFRDREDSPLGKYLEGPTTNWREPHSSEARIHARRLRKAYESYQPSVEGGTDVEVSPSSDGSRKPARKHVIDSSSETSDSEDEKVGEVGRLRRRSSAIAVPQRSKYADDTPPPTSKSYNPPLAMPSSLSSNITNTRPVMSPSQSQYGLQQRPLPVPDQNKQHHSFSTPAPAAYMQNGKQFTYPPPPGKQPVGQYAQSSSYAYTPPQAPPQGRQPQPPPPFIPRLASQPSRLGQPVQRPPSRDAPPRPKSRDGPPKSPSRLSREYTVADYRSYEEERKRQKKEKRRHISDGAAKGLLAGGGLAVFLEALDALDL